MYKSTLALAVLGLTAFGQQAQQVAPHLMFKEETMTVEYTSTAREAVVIVAAESETGLDRVEIRNPGGLPIFNMRSQSGQLLSLSGFIVETEEFDSAEIFDKYPEGIYDLRARTPDGRMVLGSASLSHELPAPPTVTYPLHGAQHVPVDLTVTWFPDPDAIGYRVVVEQGENDGLQAELPPGSSSFQVPLGILRPGTESHVEVGAIGTNRNCTLVEVAFTTL